MKPRRHQQPEFHHVQTIQKTGKRYKGWMAIGVLAILVGIVMMIFGAASGDGPPFGVPIALMGLLVYLGARIGAWWDHG